jgi:hypothetical protein
VRKRTGRRVRTSRSLHADACNPLLQAHLTWARDKHEGRGFPPFYRLSPSSFPLRAPSRADPSGLGHAATVYSSVQGPPGVETPTESEKETNGKDLARAAKTLLSLGAPDCPVVHRAVSRAPGWRWSTGRSREPLHQNHTLPTAF